MRAARPSAILLFIKPSEGLPWRGRCKLASIIASDAARQTSIVVLSRQAGRARPGQVCSGAWGEAGVRRCFRDLPELGKRREPLNGKEPIDWIGSFSSKESLGRLRKLAGWVLRLVNNEVLL